MDGGKNKNRATCCICNEASPLKMKQIYYLLVLGFNWIDCKNWFTKAIIMNENLLLI